MADANLAFILDAVRAALARRGWAPSEISVLSPPSARKRGRATFRVALEKGGTVEAVKARWLESSAEAARLFAIRATLDEAFAPPIVADDRLLLEVWIEGARVAALGGDPTSGAIAEEAGAILGRLHAHPIDAARAHTSTARWRHDAESDLAALSAAGRLTRSDVAVLAATLAANDPRHTALALVHRDFCGENIVRDARGRLRVIDNEWLEVGPAGFDLGRSQCRWPMDARTWRRFLAGYASATPLDEPSLAFWQVVAALWSARIRLGSPHVAEPLAVIQRLAREASAAGRSRTRRSGGSARSTGEHGA